ncbi:MAG: NAD-dependent deacylase [Chitinophagaceae bacterium]|nr:NAD-dependent deacylase [Chitinophagaceae bacterium]
MKRLVFFTGAGVSAESGLKTFRDSDGLWEGYDIYEVATPQAWAKNRNLVQEFYNMRRKNVMDARPNLAHQLIASLEDRFDVTVITQNIDDLHERAGSTKVLHLHGEIMKMRSEKDDTILYDIRGDIVHGAKADDGGYLRPHVVWFGEAVPNIGVAAKIVSGAEIFVVVGSSLQVYPAASLAEFLPDAVSKFLVDKNPPSIASMWGYEVIARPATEGMADLVETLMNH